MAVLSNNSSSGIQNEAERYSWAAYHIFVLLSSLIGDSLILYSTFQKDAFRLNKFIVAIIQYIAVCDLAYAVCSVLPSVISLIADTWILGDFMCYVRVYLGFFIFPAEMSLIAVLTTSKLLLLKYPIQSRIWTKNKTYVNGICCLVFVKALSFPLLFLIVDKDDLRFDFSTYSCTYSFRAVVWKSLRPILSMMNLFVPNIIIVVTTMPTLMYLAAARKSAKRVRGSVSWQGALTVALTAIVYCVSTLPNFAYGVGERFVKDHLSSSFRNKFHRYSEFLLIVNIMSNFYIYALTIKSFRNFLRAKVFLLKASLRESFGSSVSPE